MEPAKPNYPFTAVTGQRLFKLALTLLAINPSIGGLLVSGPRGSAKSTLAKGIADIMPNASNNKHSAFVTLPLSVTEEMVVGTLDLHQVLNEKQVKFKPGLLARADAGVLYVDEVNLLQDHIVDLLLDVAASGVNVIERDGISHTHDAKFVLLGTMNPDEGELRPQLQDRFGLSVELDNDYTIAERVEIVQRRQAFDTNPQAFLRASQNEQEQLKNDIQASRARLTTVDCTPELQELIATKCHNAQVDGLRADIVWYRTALAHAALYNRTSVTEADVNAVEELVLIHRRNNKPDSQLPPKTPQPKSQSPEESLKKPFSRPDQPSGSNDTQSNDNSEQENGDWGAMKPQQQKTAESVSNADFSMLNTQANARLKNKNSLMKHVTGNNKQGASQSNVAGQRLNNTQENSVKVNWFASLIANAGQWPLRQLRFNKAKKVEHVLHLVLIDTSASTLKNELFSQAKAVILNVAKQAYIKREQLSIIGFGNEQVKTLLPRQRAPKELRAFLDNVPAGGGTPLREALELAETFQSQQYRQTPNIRIKTIIITDGKTRQSFSHVNLQGEVVLIDIEKSPVKRGKGVMIANDLNAIYMPLFH